MGFWIFMLLIDFIIPVTMLGFGGLFAMQAPKKINTTFGYRTEMSMKNRDTWEFAHHYVGKLWFICGLAAAPVCVLLMLPVLGKDIDTVAFWGLGVCIVLAIPMVVSFFLTESALKKTFDENGNRR